MTENTISPAAPTPQELQDHIRELYNDGGRPHHGSFWLRLRIRIMTAPTIAAPLRTIVDAVWLHEEQYPDTVLATMECGHNLIKHMPWLCRPANLVDLRERCEVCLTAAARLEKEAEAMRL